jgi:predicted RNase H-like HicB family nuclease
VTSEDVPPEDKLQKVSFGNLTFKSARPLKRQTRFGRNRLVPDESVVATRSIVADTLPVRSRKEMIISSPDGRVLLEMGDQQMTKEFNVVIEKDEDGYFVASVPALRGCHTQAKSLDVLMKRIKEAIELCLEVEDPVSNQFVGVQRIAVMA